MNNNDFEKSIGELDKLKNINNELIRQNKEKAKILYFNGLEFKTFSKYNLFIVKLFNNNYSNNYNNEDF